MLTVIVGILASLIVIAQHPSAQIIPSIALLAAAAVLFAEHNHYGYQVLQLPVTELAMILALQCGLYNVVCVRRILRQRSWLVRLLWACSTSIWVPYLCLLWQDRGRH